MALGAAVLLGIPNALGFDAMRLEIDRSLIDPDEFFLLQAGYGRPVPTLSRVTLTLTLWAGGVGLYYLIGRWVFNRAVGRFAKSRDATA